MPLFVGSLQRSGKGVKDGFAERSGCWSTAGSVPQFGAKTPG
jgi:hypothetical protein